MLLHVHFGSGQERLYNFEWFRGDRLVPGNTVKRIITDSEGSVWLATNKGLCQFDAINSKHFTHDYQNPLSISSNNLSSVYEDDHGTIWITSYTGGLSRYDKSQPSERAFTNYTYYQDGQDTVSIRMLGDVVSDGEGNSWFGGQDTDLLKLDASTERISRLRLVPDSLGPLSIYRLYRTSDGNIWIGTRHHGIFCLDPTTGKAKAYNLKPWAKPWVEENGCGSFAEHEGVLWFSYYDHGLCKLDLETGKIETGLLGIGSNVRVYDNAIHAIAIDGGAVLAGHQSAGLYRYDIATGQTTLLDWHTLTPTDPIPDAVATLTVDSSGNVWIGTRDKGLIRYSEDQNRFATFYPMEQASPIKHLTVHDDKWWYRTEQGIGVYDPASGKTEKAFDYEGLWVSNFTIIDGTRYLSTYDRGVWLLDDDGQKSPLPIHGPTHGFRQADCGNVVADTIDGRPYLWIAAWNSGLYRYDCIDRTIKLVNAKNGLPDNKLICMAKDSKGSIWIGTDGFGLLRIVDKSAITFERFRAETPHSIPSNTVRGITCSRDGTVWLVTEYLGVSGIWRVAGGFAIKNFPNTNLAPWQNPQSLQEDAVGNLWIATEDGLMVFSKASGKFMQLQPGKGVVPPKHMALETYATLPDSTVVIVTDQGFVTGRAANVWRQQALPKAVVNTFVVHDRDFSHLLRRARIDLDHEQNFFTFAFSAPGGADPHDLQFAFMLEGVDKAWRSAKGDFSVSYTDLKQGEYRFMVRTGNYLDDWSTDVREVVIRINGPYWQTPWFYGAAIALFFLAAYGVFRYRLNQSRKLNAMQSAFNEDLKRQLAVKTSEVKAQLEHLEAERKEKLESDYRKRLSESELKAIRAQMNPHFMFNVLNSIESYILEKDAATASRLVQKFAKLNRLVLENSAYSYVSVAREWEALQLYVELEALRFNGTFDYTFAILGDYDMKSSFIPPMLVQPLIENAIHHGIRQNTAQRGNIQVTVQRSEEQVCFTIIDNGVGLYRPRVKPTQAYKKTSMGLATIEERLRLINHNSGCNTGKLDLVDLEAEGSHGTKAVLCIPLVMTPFSMMD